MLWVALNGYLDDWEVFTLVSFEDYHFPKVCVAEFLFHGVGLLFGFGGVERSIVFEVEHALVVERSELGG